MHSSVVFYFFPWLEHQTVERVPGWVSDISVEWAGAGGGCPPTARCVNPVPPVSQSGTACASCLWATVPTGPMEPLHRSCSHTLHESDIINIFSTLKWGLDNNWTSWTCITLSHRSDLRRSVSASWRWRPWQLCAPRPVWKPCGTLKVRWNQWEVPPLFSTCGEVWSVRDELPTIPTTQTNAILHSQHIRWKSNSHCD